MDSTMIVALAFAWMAGRQDPTVGQAVQNPGDITIRGVGNHSHWVRLIRGEKVELINFKELRRHPEKDIKLQPGDILEFPEAVF